MGGLNSIDLLQLIKQHSEETQVVIIASYACTDTARQHYTPVLITALCKPFDELKLITTAAERAPEKTHLLLTENCLLMELLTNSPALTKKPALCDQLITQGNALQKFRS